MDDQGDAQYPEELLDTLKNQEKGAMIPLSLSLLVSVVLHLRTHITTCNMLDIDLTVVPLPVCRCPSPKKLFR